MKPIVLAILDGYGYREGEYGNAVKMANTPNFDNLWNKFPHSLLTASGEEVGLPEGQMGNSEVGHLNIGAGRIVYQPLVLIDKAIKDKTFFNNTVLKDTINHAKNNNSKLHLMGLLSDGGVHSHIDHLFALLDFCKQENFDNVYIHVITDGRDTLPNTCDKYIKMLNEKIKVIGIGKIASVSGRFYAMDRDNRWDRINNYYEIIINGNCYYQKDILKYIDESFDKKEFDEFIKPALFDRKGVIEDNDSLIFYNYRGDRAKEILMSLTNNNFEQFRIKNISNLKITTMMPVSNKVISTSAFELQNLNNTFGEYISNLGLSQLRIAETEKYNHVTWFFDGNKEINYSKEKKLLVPSPKVTTYDLKPEMSANEITKNLIQELDNDYDYIILNYANPDMVGHTGILDATITAIETVDKNLGLIYDKIKKLGGLLIVTADHGNAEYMIDTNGDPFTAHTTNKVPFIVCNNKYDVLDGKLSDIIPSILSINNIDVPKEMTGNIIIIK